jgi:hypothetical protein
VIHELTLTSIPYVHPVYRPDRYRITVQAMMGMGGTVYFPSSPDIVSCMLRDLAAIRPTALSLVPGLVDLLRHHYQVRAARVVERCVRPADIVYLNGSQRATQLKRLPAQSPCPTPTTSCPLPGR